MTVAIVISLILIFNLIKQVESLDFTSLLAYYRQGGSSVNLGPTRDTKLLSVIPPAFHDTITSANILSNEQIAPSTHHLSIAVRRSFRSAQPGQSLGIAFPHQNNAIARLYSIAGLRDSVGHQIADFCVKRVPGGIASNFLCDRLPGDPLPGLYGPVGDRLVIKPNERKLILIGAGTGVAPFRALLQAALDRPVNDPIQFMVFFGFRNYESFLYLDDLKRFPSNVNVSFSKEDGAVVSLPKSWKVRKGYVQEALKVERETVLEFVKNGGSILICGSTDMGKGVLQVLKEVVLGNELFREMQRTKRLRDELY